MNNGLFNFPNKIQEFDLPEKDNLILWCKSNEFINFNDLQPIFTIKNFANAKSTGLSSYSKTTYPILYKNVLNKNPAIRFNGSSSLMTCNSIFDSKNFIIFFVSIPLESKTNILFEQCDIAESQPSLENTTTLDRKFYIYNGGALAPRPAIINTPDICTMISNNGLLQNCINGMRGDKIQSTYTPNTSHSFYLGGRMSGSYFSKFDFFEMIVYNKTLDLFTINKIENYLSKKYNIRLGV